MTTKTNYKGLDAEQKNAIQKGLVSKRCRLYRLEQKIKTKLWDGLTSEAAVEDMLVERYRLQRGIQQISWNATEIRNAMASQETLTATA